MRRLLVVGAILGAVLILAAGNRSAAEAVDEVGVDCTGYCMSIDTKSLPGTQSERSVLVGTRFTVDVVVRGDSPPPMDILYFDLGVGYDQTVLTAPMMSGAPQDTNPDYVEGHSTLLHCGVSLHPNRDIDPDPDHGIAAMHCVSLTGVSQTMATPPFSIVRVTFDAVAVGSSPIEIGGYGLAGAPFVLELHEGDQFSLWTCPSGPQVMPCFDGTINVCAVATIFETDTDNDRMADTCDDDDDNDGLGDAAEAAQGSSSMDFDSDDDGVRDPKEFLLELDPNSADTPGDGWCSDTVRVMSVNGDPIINSIDLLQIGNHHNTKGDTIWDTDGNGIVNSLDRLIAALKFGQNCL